MIKRKRNQDGGRKSIAFFSGMFFIAGLSVLVMIGISLGKETYRKRQIQKEIESLQEEISRMNHENSELSNLISYFSTQEFQEKEAREKLNLQKEDERMIVLRKEIEGQEKTEEKNTQENQNLKNDNLPNWKKWLEYFFANKS